MHSLAVLVALVLVSVAAAAPDNARRFFPLKVGSEWTFEDTRYGGASTIRTIRIDVQPPPELSDGGIVGLWFAPGVGLVRWVEQTIAGPTAHVLVSGPRM